MSARPSANDAGINAARRWVAVEGPCCAGKTTLSRGLRRRLTDVVVSHVPDYADHVGGGRFLPRAVPTSVKEDQQALQTLLAIEADRVADARASTSSLVLLDRSVYTLLAHRHAIQHITGLPCLAPASRMIECSTAVTWPDLVLYLDVTQQAVHDRNRGKFPPDSIFIDVDFNAGIRDYFSFASKDQRSPIAWLDATLDPEDLVRSAETLIRGMVPGKS